MSRTFSKWKSIVVEEYTDNDGDLPPMNPIYGCNYDCYFGNCWAARFSKRFGLSFEPGFDPEKMSEVPKDSIVWLCNRGDISQQPLKRVKRIVKEIIKPNNDKIWFLETKNPAYFSRLIGVLPENVLLSTTIESNRNYPVTLAPSPEKRFKEFKKLDWELKHVSVEPIMDFDYNELADWLIKIEPRVCSVGYGNQYVKGQLPEPPLTKTMELIERLEDSRIEQVERKHLRERVEGERSRKVRKEFRRGNTDWYREQRNGDRHRQDVTNRAHNDIQSEGFFDSIKKWMAEML